MTQDEIIEMAQECALIGMRPHLDGIYSEALVTFAKLVAEKALAEHAMRETQRLGQEIEQEPVINKWVLREVYFDEDGEPTMHRSPPQPERHELQAKGEHPAPCARHCEANAFQIVIKNLKAQLAQPEQEPHGWYIDGYGAVIGTAEPKSVRVGEWLPWYTRPPQRTEQKMVMWPCLIDTADFSKGTVTVVMQCKDYKVSAGTHWLSTTPPKRTT